MASKNQVSIKVLDQTFTLVTSSSPEKVQKIADHVTTEVQSIISKSRNITPYTAALLAAMNICEKYFDTLEKQVDFKSRVAEKSKKIIGLLESQKNQKDQKETNL
jgi:cell division protein ZapA (FtsZ GTPase activity inhibitor)